MVLFLSIMIAFFGLSFIYLVPMILCLLGVKHTLLPKWRKESIRESAFIPAINGIEAIAVLYAFIEIPFELKKRYNGKRVCSSCGVVSYEGRTLIHSGFNGEERRCPCCEDKNAYLSTTNSPVVIGTKFSLLESIKLYKNIKTYNSSKSSIKNTEYIDDQIAKYNAVQQARLEKMKKKEKI